MPPLLPHAALRTPSRSKSGVTPGLQRPSQVRNPVFAARLGSLHKETTMAVITHANPHHASSQPAQPGRHAHFSARRICLGMVLLCIGIAALALPLVRDALNLVQSQTHWKPLEHWLAQAPMASWLMMFVWGTLVPVSLLVMLRFHRNVIGALAALAFAVVAVVWYVHMPQQSQCAALYSDSLWCAAIAWGYSLSLGIANAVYLFALVMLLLGGVSFAAMPKDDEEEKP